MNTEPDNPSQEDLDANYPNYVHDWFELTYAEFLTIPRLVMQSMPPAWQRQMVGLLKELDDTFDWRPENGRYWVRIRDDKGRFHAPDHDICNYRHGNVEHLRKRKDDVSRESLP